MDLGQIIFVYSRLIFSTLMVFLGIMLWSKIRDIAWMFVIIGAIIAYIEIIYSNLEPFGVITGSFLRIGSVSLVAILLPVLRMAFLIAAFLVMLIRWYRSNPRRMK